MPKRGDHQILNIVSTGDDIAFPLKIFDSEKNSVSANI